VKRDGLIVLVASLLATAPVWIPTFPPMTDLPQHASQVALLQAMLHGGFSYESSFHINWFTPYPLGYLLVYGLAPLVGIVTACFLNFLVAAPLGLVFLWLALRQERWPTPGGAIGLAAAINALFFCHALTCVFFGLIGGFILLLSGKTPGAAIRRILPLASVAPVMILWGTRTIGNPLARMPVISAARLRRRAVHASVSALGSAHVVRVPLDVGARMFQGAMCSVRLAHHVN